MRRPSLRDFLLPLVAIGLVLDLQAAWPHGITLKIEHALPEDSAFHTQFLAPWAEKVEQESAGRLRIHLYPAMQLGGDAPQLYDLVKNGTIDIAWTALSHSPDRFAALDAFELPFMASERKGSSAALWEYVRLSDRAQMELDGVRLLAIHQPDAPQFHMRSKAITSLQDLSGAKIATRGGVGSKLLAALGAVAAEMAGAQIAEALSSGAVDGALLPWESVPLLKLQDLVKVHSETDPKSPWLYSSVFVLAMSSASYKSLPEDLRRVIDANSGVETAVWLNRVFRDRAAAARAQSLNRGDAINTISAEELMLWRKPAQAVIDDWMKELAKAGIGGKPILDAAREARAEYDPSR